MEDWIRLGKWLIAALLLAQSLQGCSSILLGDGNTDDSRRDEVALDERAAAQVSSDQAITRAVSSALSVDKLVGPYGIAVSTRDGTVKLSGTVATFEARDQAKKIVEGVDGVAAIDNQIRVDTR